MKGERTHLNVPSSLSESMETELVSNFSSVHGVGQVLLVGENEKKRIPKFVLVEHPLELLAGLRHTLPIVGIHNENDTLGVLEV